MGRTEVYYSVVAQVVFWVLIWGVLGKAVCVCVVFTRLIVEFNGSGQGMDHFFTTTCERDKNINMGKIERQTDR